MHNTTYTPLHLHTEYSTLDGIIRIKQLVEYLKEHHFQACAITDHGMLSGLIEFYKTMKKAEIKPLLSTEAYLTFDEDGIEENKDKTKDNMHVVLTAMNSDGLANLIELNNRAHLYNFYYKPRISIQNLMRLNDGLICSSACLGGIISKLGVYDEGNKSFDDQDGNAKAQLELFLKIFEDRFYAEIQDLPAWEQQAYNKWLIAQAKDMSIPLIITSDAHFLTEEDFETHRLIMAQHTGKTLDEYTSDDDGLIYQREHHVRVPYAMLQAARRMKAEEAYYNTNEIADRCDVEITLGEHQFPTFDITQEPDYQDFLTWKETSCLSQEVRRR